MTNDSLSIDGLRDLSEIGRGGFGIVYRAVETDLDRAVAVKILLEPGTGRALRQLDRERKAMGVLSGHPNIVTIHRTGLTDGGVPYLVMELLTGGSLDAVLRAGGPLDWRRAIEIAITLCGGLESAHRAGVLHRDIKPANVLLSELGTPKLGDFGIARVSAVSETTGAVKATVAHAPPEVLSGREPDARADVYSMASTLYELVTGSPAFVRPGDSSVAPIITRILNDPVPEPGPELVPARLAEAIAEAMAKRPDDRVSSASGLGELLRAVQRREGIGVTPLAVQAAAPLYPAHQSEVGDPAIAAGMQPGATSLPTPPADPETAASVPGPHRPQPVAPADAEPAPSAPGPHWPQPAAPADAEPAPSAPGPHWPQPLAGAALQGPARPSPVGRWPIWVVSGSATALVVLGLVALAVLGGRDGSAGTTDGDPTAPSAAPSGSTDGDTATGDDTAELAPAAATTVPAESTVPPEPPIDLTTFDGRFEAVMGLLSGDLDPQTAGLPDYDSYETVGDSTRGVTVRLPTAWQDIELEAWESLPAGLQIATTIDGLQAGDAESGAGLYVFRKADFGYTVDSLLDAIIGVNDFQCAEEPPSNFEHPQIIGRFKITSRCEIGYADRISIHMSGELAADDRYIVQISIVISTQEDLMAAATILETYRFWPDRFRG